MLDVNLGFLAPDTHELLSRGAQHICVNVALAVACIGNEDKARVLQQCVVAFPIAAERACQCNRAHQFLVHKCLDIGIVRVDQVALEFARCADRHENCAGDWNLCLRIFLQRGFHRRRLFAVEPDDR